MPNRAILRTENKESLMEKSKAEAPTKQDEKTVKNHPEPRNFLAAFLLVLNLGPLGVNRIYTGETTIGWVRFGIFVAGLLLSPVIVGVPLFLVALVWGWVDVFLVYFGDHKDADGVKMVETLRDRKLAKVLYIVYLVGLILVGVGIVLGVASMILAAVFYGAHPGSMMDSFHGYDYNNTY